MTDAQTENRIVFWVFGTASAIALVAAGFLTGSITTSHTEPETVIVTNTVTRTVQSPDYSEIAWRDGVFWGALAVAKGATNLMDAETRAVAMRAEAVRANQQLKQQLQSNPSNLTQR